MNSVDVIVVTFNPDDEVLSRLYKISKQVRKLIIVDNGSYNTDMLKSIRHYKNVDLILLEDNFGIAHALNIGLVSCDGKNEWIGFFDQDSNISDGFIQKMLEEYDKISLCKLDIAIISSRFEGSYQSDSKVGYSIIEECITAGSFIKYDLLKEIGGFIDNMFIDYVDTEYSLRTRSKNFKIISLNEVVLDHKAGFPKKKKFLFKYITLSNHNKTRKYYIMRNRIYVYKLYFKKYPRWVILDSKKIPLEFFKIIFGEKHRKDKIWFSIKGIYHGFLNKLGRIE